jgi:hypothetical protein
MAVCVVCGAVSGNLEAIDFDNHGELFAKWAEALPQELFDRLVIERTPSGGFHASYRCAAPVGGNLKLATGMRDGKRTTLIETRGEGGYVKCAPSAGYKLVQGDFLHLPSISPFEQEILICIAKDLDRGKSAADGNARAASVPPHARAADLPRAPYRKTSVVDRAELERALVDARGGEDHAARASLRDKRERTRTAHHQ